MLAVVIAHAQVGIKVEEIRVEVDIAHGLPSFSIVGLPEKSLRESRERVRSAVTNSGYKFPMKRITASLTPADIPKYGSSYDLPIAIGILVASQQLPSTHIAHFSFWGGLSLSGELLGSDEVLSIALSTVARGQDEDNRILIAPSDCREVLNQVTRVNALCKGSLKDVGEILGKSLADSLSEARKNQVADRARHRHAEPQEEPFHLTVNNQPDACLALQLAAIGKHDILLCGPPGTGKTYLARALANLLPPLSQEHMLEVMHIHSLAGLPVKVDASLPIRSPHHSVSPSALIGNAINTRIMPGEISLAHNGVLLLDEVTEFQRHALNALREPLQERSVHIARAKVKAHLPCNFHLIATCNLCPCGKTGLEKQTCECSETAKRHYIQKLSGPLIDRIDLAVMMRPASADFTSSEVQTLNATTVQDIAAARDLRAAHADPHDLNELRESCHMDKPTDALFVLAVNRFNLSYRSQRSILRVAKSITCWQKKEVVGMHAIELAIRLNPTRTFATYE